MKARWMTGQCLLVLMVAGCVSTAPPQYFSRIGEEPVAGVEAQARVGESVYTKFDYRSEELLRLVQGINQKYSGCLGCVISVAPGAVIEKRVSGGEYCTRVGHTLRGSIGPGDDRVVCFTRHATRDEVVQLRVAGTLGTWNAVDPPVAFEHAEVMVGEGFKSELVYQGVAASVLRLLYREYSENLARPAFQQELTYTMEAQGPTEVGFRGLRLEVLGADNSGIRYRVVTGL